MTLGFLPAFRGSHPHKVATVGLTDEASWDLNKLPRARLALKVSRRRWRHLVLGEAISMRFMVGGLGEQMLRPPSSQQKRAY